MHKIESIVSQYNHSGRSDRFLKALQTTFLKEGEKVIYINNKQFIIQKSPSLLYKVIDLTKLQGELKQTLDNTPNILKHLRLSNYLKMKLNKLIVLKTSILIVNLFVN